VMRVIGFLAGPKELSLLSDLELTESIINKISVIKDDSPVKYANFVKAMNSMPREEKENVFKEVSEL
jgi:hypothetical protein